MFSSVPSLPGCQEQEREEGREEGWMETGRKIEREREEGGRGRDGEGVREWEGGMEGGRKGGREGGAFWRVTIVLLACGAVGIVNVTGGRVDSGQGCQGARTNIDGAGKVPKP
jgi:hypothetical protein